MSNDGGRLTESSPPPVFHNPVLRNPIRRWVICLPSPHEICWPFGETRKDDASIAYGRFVEAVFASSRFAKVKFVNMDIAGAIFAIVSLAGVMIGLTFVEAKLVATMKDFPVVFRRFLVLSMEKTRTVRITKKTTTTTPKKTKKTKTTKATAKAAKNLE